MLGRRRPRAVVLLALCAAGLLPRLSALCAEASGPWRPWRTPDVHSGGVPTPGSAFGPVEFTGDGLAGGAGFLRGGGGDGLPEVGGLLPAEFRRAGESVLKALDKSGDGALGAGYYEQGDRALQEWGRSLQRAARATQRAVSDDVLPQLEDAALHAYYLARHPPEALAAAQSALRDCSRSAEAGARAVKDSIPGVGELQRTVRNRWLRFRIRRPVCSELISCCAASAGGYLGVIAAAQRLAFSRGWSHYTSKGQPALVLGALAVALAGVAAGECNHWTASTLRPNTYRLAAASPDKGVRVRAARLVPVQTRTLRHRVGDAAASLACFKLLRGSLRRVAPADLTKPGPFAREWVETNGENYATYGQRMRVNAVGWKRGCHHCGTRVPNGLWSVGTKWVCDHQPPNKIVAMAQAVEQRFYPHCRACSSQQSTAVKYFGDARFERTALKLHLPQQANILGPSFLSVYPIVHYLSQVRA